MLYSFRDYLGHFAHSMFSWLYELLYRSSYYILMFVMLFTIPSYIRILIKYPSTFHQFTGAFNFGFIVASPHYLFTHSFEADVLTMLGGLSIFGFLISLLHLFRTVPIIRLYMAQIGRRKYASQYFGYGKDDTGRYNEGLKGRGVGWIESILYDYLTIPSDKRSASHIAQKPKIGSSQPEAGFYYDTYIYRRDLIDVEPGSAYYISYETMRYLICLYSSTIFFIVFHVLNGRWNDPRYNYTLWFTVGLNIVSLIIIFTLSMHNHDDDKDKNGQYDHESLSFGYPKNIQSKD